jgi:hypothetical protein
MLLSEYKTNIVAQCHDKSTGYKRQYINVPGVPTAM